ncbi:MAG: hypothetical protein PHN39_04115, partial [Candidatus Pacebacteria bacterium]|nr:hypothetical protein [Candidatus Paceibacterota bacterium]
KQIIRSFTKTKLGIKTLPKNYKKILRLIDAAKNTRRKFKNLKQDLNIISEMSKRRRAKTKTYANYLAVVSKQNNLSEKEMRKLEKLNPQDVDREKRYTSKGVAMKVALSKRKSKDSYVRKRLERLKKRVIKN